VDRRAFITIVGGSILAAPRVAQGQQAGKIYRIGYLSGGSSTAAPHLVEALRQGLRELGWIEGQNIIIEYRRAEGRSERLPDLAAELVRFKVDTIVAPAIQDAAAAKNATGTIPIVMVVVTDPVGTGLIASLARPGGNITGLSFSVGVETYGKALGLLKETVPKIRRVAILWNPANPSQSLAIREVKGAARSMGVQLQLLESRGPSEFDGAFAVMAKERRPEALLVVSDTLFILHRTRLAELAARHRLPAVYASREYVDTGGLMSYGASLADSYRRAATYVDKILRGAKPADLPVEQPTKFELVINLKTAKALGLTISPSVLGRADLVIE
jgi:putative ABC transport system substrate-binding protein